MLYNTTKYDTTIKYIILSCWEFIVDIVNESPTYLCRLLSLICVCKHYRKKLLNMLSIVYAFCTTYLKIILNYNMTGK